MSSFRQPITQLSTDQKQKLVSALLKCQNVADRQSRDAIVRDLPDDIKNNIKRNDTDRVDAVGIVSTALSYVNGLDELIKLVHLYEGNSLGMQAVNEVYLRAQLISIIQGFDIASTVFSSVFRHWQILPPDCRLSVHSPEILVETLWDLNISLHRWQRLFEFTERLARQLEHETTVNKLRKWTEYAFSIVGNELEFTTIHDVFTGIEQRDDLPNDGPNYLTVEITSDFVDSPHTLSKLYQVQIFFWRGNKQDYPWRAGDEPAITLEDIPEVIAETLLEYIGEWEDTELVIEFLVPNELLLCDFDQWENKLKKTKGARLGMDYPIVVRSLQRLKRRASWPNWRDKWNTFEQYGNQQHILHAFWLCTCEETDWQIFQLHSHSHCIEHTYWLRVTVEEWSLALQYQLINATTVTCLGMTFAFLEKPREDDDLFTALIESGIPTAFWLRSSHYASEPPTHIQTKLQQIFDNQPLKKLPQALHRARRQSVVDKTIDISNNLTLLWDDRDRIPAQYKDQPRTKNKRRLRAPQPAQPGRRAS